jgi:nicotinate-nucleotide adenylyltransferase
MNPTPSSPSWSKIVAIFGGAFDPPHIGHREAVRGLFSAPGIKRVIVLPTAAPALKSSAALADHRFAMARLNFEDTAFNRFPSEVEVDSRELARAKLNGRPSYTYETLLELRQIIPELAFVVGTDQLRDFSRWFRFPELLELSHWIVLGRRPEGIGSAQEVLKDWVRSGIARPLAGVSDFPTWRLRGGQTSLVIVPTDAPAISSTQIRESLGRSETLPDHLLFPSVLAYLKQHGLYGTKRARESV